MRKAALLVATAGLIAGAALYRSFLRGPILTWGATEDEAGRRLPGDELLDDADGVSTRAIDDQRSALLRSGRGSPRWGRRRAAAPTPTTGSRTCSA